MPSLPAVLPCMSSLCNLIVIPGHRAAMNSGTHLRTENLEIPGSRARTGMTLNSLNLR
jgi:hypothetical protein